MQPFKGLQSSVSKHKKSGKDRRVEKELKSLHLWLGTGNTQVLHGPGINTPKNLFLSSAQSNWQRAGFMASLVLDTGGTEWIRHSLYDGSSGSKRVSLSRGIGGRGRVAMGQYEIISFNLLIKFLCDRPSIYRACVCVFSCINMYLYECLYLHV